jgi:hypothetical protein
MVEALCTLCKYLLQIVKVLRAPAMVEYTCANTWKCYSVIFNDEFLSRCFEHVPAIINVYHIDQSCIDQNGVQW